MNKVTIGFKSGNVISFEAEEFKAMKSPTGGLHSLEWKNTIPSVFRLDIESIEYILVEKGTA
jgi:hypothetical protein